MACACGTENQNILSSIQSLDKKIDMIRDRHIDPIGRDLAVVKQKVDMVHRTVHEGNGQPSLVSRVTVLETAGELQERLNNSKSGILVSRLAFWGAIIAALLSAGSALVIAVIRGN